MRSSDLLNVRRRKNDEFYTLMEDIEAESSHYRQHLQGKSVYCSCDDSNHSNFWKYFERNFDSIGLTRLTATCYMLGQSRIKTEIRRDPQTGLKTPPIKKTLRGDGDFQSEECMTLLRESNVVVTHFPFSLGRKFLPLVVSARKKFIVLGNINTATYKEVFPLLQSNQIWLGANSHAGSRTGNSLLFHVPETIGLKKGHYWKGKRCAQVPAWWFTNFKLDRRKEPMTSTRRYVADKYPFYDNFRAIEVGKTRDIPMDYDGVMGVPISFLPYYCPAQFQILWIASGHFRTTCPPEIQRLVGYKDILSDTHARGYGILNGYQVYHRLLIRRRADFELLQQDGGGRH